MTRREFCIQNCVEIHLSGRERNDVPTRAPTIARRSSVPLQELAYSRLRADITNGALPPGASLREEELSRHLGVSRTPLREALRRLAEEGLVEVSPYRGARVVRLNTDQLEELFEAREALEGMAARLAAVRMPLSRIRQIHQRLQSRLREVGRRPGKYHPPRLDFHLEILQASGNRTLAILAERLYARLALARALSGAFRERAEPAAREHLDILAAIRRRDPEAAERLMRRHIRRSRENLRRFLSETSAGTAPWTPLPD
ncbi:MAG: GntR family transcriptional regulator [Armatimonadota bacterium]|nr:GntR family transcriptional regulator [Armatimonadota bacterium]MDR7437996.1 GntR family transcriptional regulator [Armatimonadota bacterium]MDR7473078.1 GntR family transcriptional regulator [Armatimonadota bacterium]MDR7507406.1 GntR family transcriptional regulator [Armatimonadota bacterium]MDR7509415.1 GntR family transcriptional regulator [Armatimonadota bacterium]